MGMAASQARYLALTARKTNTEWEGQQINQARTALANQSANLFNQLLGLEVPNPPKETDYTELQYSYSDGDNDSVIDKWQRITTPDANYNYIVTHYYMAELFTGSKKQLQDPQIQLNDVLKELNYDKNTTTVEKDGAGIKVTYKINKYDYDQKYEKLTDEQVASNEELKRQFTNFADAMHLAKLDGSLSTDAAYGYQDADGTWHFFIANDYTRVTENEVEQNPALKEALRKYEIEHDLLKEIRVLNYDNVYGTQKSDGSWEFLVSSDANKITENQVNENPKLETALRDYEEKQGLIPPGAPLIYDNIHGYQDSAGWHFIQTTPANAITEEKTEADPTLKTALTRYEIDNNIAGREKVLTYNGIFGYQDSDGSYHFTVDKMQPNDEFIRPMDYTDYSTVYGPSKIGNSKLKELNKLIVDESKGIDQVADLAQILKDCPNDAINQYVSFDTEGNLQYGGYGIYTFDLNGKTYYTTEQDLYNSVVSGNTASNSIDNQARLNYYNASYVEKRIEETNKALLETDGNGRFTSVKFDNDSVTYNLNVEEVTNEVAYESALNQYLYKKAQYEKTIADINAKTSIIQKEDRTLELRLKQLDTEQNALSTEMDAVKKVIKDNVEKTFKTFSD